MPISKKELIDRVQQLLDSIALFEPDTLVANRGNNHFDFQIVRYLLTDIVEKVRKCRLLPYDRFPLRLLTTFCRTLEQITSLFQAVDDFHLLRYASQDDWRELIQTARLSWGRLRTVLSEPAFAHARATVHQAAKPSTWLSKFPTWFAILTAIVYATGFLVVSMFHESYGLRTVDIGTFELKYVHVGFLCLALPTILAALSCNLCTYWQVRYMDGNEHLAREQFLHPWLTFTLVMFAMIFFVSFLFSSPGLFRSPRVQVILAATIIWAYMLSGVARWFRYRRQRRDWENRIRAMEAIGLVLLFVAVVWYCSPNITELFWNRTDPWDVCAWYAIAVVFVACFIVPLRNCVWSGIRKCRRKRGHIVREHLSWCRRPCIVVRWRLRHGFILPLVVGCLFVLVLLHFGLYYSRVYRSESQWPVGIWYLALPMLWGYRYSFGQKSLESIALDKAKGLLIGVNVCVLAILYFVMVMVFGYSIYHYVPAGRGGGDFSAASLVKVRLKGDSKEVQQDWLCFDNDDKVLVVVEGTNSSIFVAKPTEKGSPENWRKGRSSRPRVVEIPRSEIDRIEYLNVSAKEWIAKSGRDRSAN